MATIEIELFTSKKLKKEQYRHPIYIKVFKDGVPRRKLIGVAHENEWDSEKQKIKPKGRKDHVLDNIKIEDEFAKYKATFNKLDRSGNNWKAEDVFNDEPKEDKPVTFYGHAKAYLKSLNEGDMFYDGANSRYKKIKRFATKDFLISDINDAWIAGFIKHCQTKEKNKKGEPGNSKNTINHAFRLIKRIVSFAGEENEALKKYKLSDDKNIRSKLTEKEIKSILKLKLTPGTPIYHAKNIFLVQYYFRGMRIGDALRLESSDFLSGRLKYSASKTKKQYDMKIVDGCQAILNEYLTKKEGYIFPFLRIMENPDNKKEFKAELKNRTMVINRNLKLIAYKCGITKTVTTHIARHSFASIADQHLGGDLKTLQGLFGHSTREMTEIYIRDLRKTDELDDAADKVLG